MVQPCGAPGAAGAFAGREGIVVTPVLERMDDQMIPPSTNGRVILKISPR